VQIDDRFGAAGQASFGSGTGPEAEVRTFLGMSAVLASPAMRSVMQLVERIAQSRAAVLITGESGSGKELVARAIHTYSPRSLKSWIDINCAALPDHLLESELFGFEKGAFSGADALKQGMFELANDGTLFLDEIGDLNLKSQSKLLRVLDGCPHYRLGGIRKIEVDVRIVTATNMNLEHEVAQGRFRADLFHRLNQVQITVPPLRDRPEDIGPLAALFLQKENPPRTIAADAVAALECYSWPGNVRELRNLMARLAVTVNGPEITRRDLPAMFQATHKPEEDSPSHCLEKLEQEVIIHALEQAEGRRSRAAEMLGISRRTLIRRLKLYGVNPTRPVVCDGLRLN
jgi:two-component system response regulator AtoC